MSTGTTLLDSSSPTEAGWSRPAISVWALLGGALVALAHLPVVWQYCSSLLSLPHYEYILALPIFSGILLYSRARDLGQLAPGDSFGCAMLFALAAATLVAAGVFDSPWLGSIAALWALLATAYAVGGGVFLRAVLPAWCVLVLAIRLPMLLDEQLIRILQVIAATKASAILHFMGEPHILDGNVVETPTKRYMVEEACSGVQSLFAITACTVFYVLWSRMSWWRAIFILLAAWWWVWVANVTRVVLVTYLNSHWGIPVDEGIWHDALGVCLFALTLGLIVSTGHLIWFFLPEGIFGGRDRVEAGALLPNAHNQEIVSTRFPALRETTLASPVLTLFYAMVLVVIWLPQWRVPEATASATQLNLLGDDFAPAQFQGWTLVPGSHKIEQRMADSQWGARSQSWQYQNGARHIIVSIDYPFLGWHELTTCYAGSGWGIESREVVDFSQIASDAKTHGDIDRCVEIHMRRPVQNDFGMIVFQCFNDRRDPMPIPENNIFKMLVNRLQAYRQRLKTMGASGSGLHAQARSFQLQVLLQDHAPLVKQDQEAVRQLFARFRTQLQSTLPAALEGESP